MSSEKYSIAISKEQLAELPLVEFPGAITVLETMPDALSALRFLSTQSIVGFDTETKPNFRKGQCNTVSLIQISTADHSFLFRLNKLGFFEEMRKFLECETTTKVGLSLKDDFHVLHKLSPFEPGGFIDLQDMVKKYNISDSSLQKVYGIIFSGRISKSKRLSNWEAPTLSESQQIYASIDAWACLRIYHYLHDGRFNPAESPYKVYPCETT
ncbi:MAG: 3'-5' exonuclease domain-containing protein 2 [Duncaniella sp.]|nr:3'-5' exonuclease domain-containing protein 2 [Duncaniella sp.]MDE6581677.1 3'-5' exonuclease domain-containing protein 2 [Duncaniella sp.]